MASFSSLIFLLCFVILAGCAGETKYAECQALDWFEIGRRTGASGKKALDIKNPVPQCPANESDRLAFEMGRQSGLTEYCHPQNALSLGRTGQTHQNSCPPALSDEFIANYEKGQKIYQLQQENDDLNDQMNSLYETLRDPRVNPVKKGSLKGALKSLQDRRTQNLTEIEKIESRLL